MTGRFTIPKRHWPATATIDDECVLDARRADPVVGEVVCTGGRR